MCALLTRKEAAAKLGITVVTLDAMRSSGSLAYIQYRPGGKVWIAESAIHEYLARATHQARPVRTCQSTYRRRRT